MSPSSAGAVAVVPSRIALLGPPNVGKTSLFNALTGMFQKIGNYAGVTVEKTQGWIQFGPHTFPVTDLPGTPSLITVSPDEEVVLRYLQGADPTDRPDLVVVILDATRLRRGLFLLSQVIEFGLPAVVCLNMIDEARAAGLDVSAAQLEKVIGLPCVETVARRGLGLEELKAAIQSTFEKSRSASSGDGSKGVKRWVFPPEVEARFQQSLDVEPIDGCERAWNRIRAFVGEDQGLKSLETFSRYQWVETLLHGRTHVEFSNRTDRIMLHPLLGPMIFIMIMGVVFQSIYTWAEPAMESIEALTEWCSTSVRLTVGSGLFGDLIVDGMIAGVGAVLVFLPQILLLFFFIGILEDTGYLARAAFIVDRPLSVVGLSGRAFIPLLSSYACAIPGIMAARTIPSRWERFKTIFIAPLMTCSARLPVYTLLIAAFVPSTPVLGFFTTQGLVLLALYLVGILGSVLVAAILGTPDPESEVPMILELPPYRWPMFRVIIVRMWQRASSFVKRAGTIILKSSIIIWALLSFPIAQIPEGADASRAQGIQIEQSYAGRLGHAIEPVIAPLGYDWKIGIGLIASLAAREVFVSTMGVVYSLGSETDEESQALRSTMRTERHSGSGELVYSLPTVLSLLVFYIFALQCVSTLAVVWRETGSFKIPIAQFVTFTLLAYAAAWVTKILATWAMS